MVPTRPPSGNPPTDPLSPWPHIKPKETDSPLRGAGDNPSANKPHNLLTNPNRQAEDEPPLPTQDGPTDYPGSRLTLFTQSWAGASRWAKTVVSRGYHWEWKAPPQLRVPSNSQEGKNILPLILKLVKKGAVREVRPQKCFLSRIFAVPKPDGSSRLVLDLSTLNTFIVPVTYKMQNHSLLRSTLNKDTWMASLDITEAYLHVPIRKSLHSFLAFSVEKRLFFFTTLPFGLSTAPWVFTKLLKFPLAHLRRLGVKTIAYLDDWILWQQSRAQLLKDITCTTRHLEHLGFLLNYKKSSLKPTKVIQWLGITWDSGNFQVSLPLSFQEKFVSLIKKILHKKSSSRREWERLTGMAAFVVQVLPQTGEHFYSLARPQLLTSVSRDTPTRVPGVLLQPLRNWLLNGWYKQTSPFRPPAPTLTIWTDASEHGWGAFTEDGREAQGTWSTEEKTKHINILELRAISRALTALAPLPPSIQIATDSSCAVAAIRKRGSRSTQIQTEVSSLLSKAQELTTFVRAHHIAGVTNVIADALSRPTALEAEWELPAAQFALLSKTLGTPQVDLFASPRNNKLPIFVSPFAHPKATAVDALAISWNQWSNIYLFPPPALLLQVAQRLEAFQGRALIIAPYRPTAPWFPVLSQLCVPSPFLPTPSQWTGEGKTRKLSISSDRWTAYIFCGPSTVTRSPTEPQPLSPHPTDLPHNDKRK